MAPSGDTAEPVTLQLSIPADFQNVTFHAELFGRSFAMRDGKLVTSIPWEPGQRVLTFTYFLRNTSEQKVWERTLDLPTDALELRVATAAPDRVKGNLARVSTTPIASDWEVLFTSDSRQLPAQYVVQCTLDALPVPWMVYGKWCAALVLVALIVYGSIARRRRRSVATQHIDAAHPSVSPTGQPMRSLRKSIRRAPHRRRRAA